MNQLQNVARDFGVAPDQLRSMLQILFPTRPSRKQAVSTIKMLAATHSIDIKYDLNALYDEVFFTSIT